jgi:hypothetical protein
VPSVPCGECEWAVVVETQNPSKMVDLDGACANSSLNMDDAAITASAGERKAYGYVLEYLGHNPALMRLNEELGAWEPLVYAAWSAETGELMYDRRDGSCDYEVSTEPGVVKTGICGLEGEAIVLPR